MSPFLVVSPLCSLTVMSSHRSLQCALCTSSNLSHLIVPYIVPFVQPPINAMSPFLVVCPLCSLTVMSSHRSLRCALCTCSHLSHLIVPYIVPFVQPPINAMSPFLVVSPLCSLTVMSSHRSLRCALCTCSHLSHLIVPYIVPFVQPPINAMSPFLVVCPLCSLTVMSSHHSLQCALYATSNSCHLIVLYGVPFVLRRSLHCTLSDHGARVVLLLQIGEKLGKIEVEKQQAVDNEDYDAAKLMKVQMEELRQVAYSNSHVQSLIDRPDVVGDWLTDQICRGGDIVVVVVICCLSVVVLYRMVSYCFCVVSHCIVSYYRMMMFCEWH